MRTQLAKNSSIFQCDEYAVLSNETLYRLTPGLPRPGTTGLQPLPGSRVETTIMNSDMVPLQGVGLEVVLNVNIFIEAFDTIRRDGRFRNHDWVVKVDPDAVFLPARLKQHLRLLPPYPGMNVYLLNCDKGFGFFGSIEVYSRLALDTYFTGLSECQSGLDWQKMGEDLFMRRCMDFLSVEHRKDYDLLADGYCKPQSGGCVDGNKVAFHPFKTSLSLMKCMDQTGQSTGIATPEVEPWAPNSDHSGNSEESGDTDFPKGCHNAVPGEACYKAVTWAKSYGIYEHRSWYKGVSGDSSFSDFQAALHADSKGDCSVPCSRRHRHPRATALPQPMLRRPQHHRGHAEHHDVGGKGCHNAESGEACFTAVEWAQAHGLYEHPSRYPGLNNESGVLEFQEVLHAIPDTGCPMPCIDF